MFAGNRRASKIMKGIEFYAIASFLILDVFFLHEECTITHDSCKLQLFMRFFCYRWATFHISFSAVK